MKSRIYIIWRRTPYDIILILVARRCLLLVSILVYLFSYYSYTSNLTLYQFVHKRDAWRNADQQSQKYFTMLCHYWIQNWNEIKCIVIDILRQKRSLILKKRLKRIEHVNEQLGYIWIQFHFVRSQL